MICFICVLVYLYFCICALNTGHIIFDNLLHQHFPGAQFAKTKIMGPNLPVKNVQGILPGPNLPGTLQNQRLCQMSKKRITLHQFLESSSSFLQIVYLYVCVFAFLYICHKRNNYSSLHHLATRVQYIALIGYCLVQIA